MICNSRYFREKKKYIFSKYFRTFSTVVYIPIIPRYGGSQDSRHYYIVNGYVINL